ncbi:MAG: FAD-binding protein [Planctomycetes bacterium]|nr:FAD-binding protein [Planctomycetota bacterium]
MAGSLSDSILPRLLEIVGDGSATAAIEDRVCYASDGTKQRAMPDVVTRPTTTEQVAAIVRLANEQSVPVLARGAGTSLSGGAVPVRGGIVLDFTRMNRVLEVDPPNLLAVVEPGVVTADFQTMVERQGLFFPPDPASAEFSTIGGNVAECAGGLRGLKYGVTRDYVMGLEVVLASGEVIHTGSRTLKSVTGYDLTKFFVGSEGTLGIFTKITLRLIPLPPKVRTLAAFFDSYDKASDTALAIVSKGILPRGLEFMDEVTIECVRNYGQGAGLPANAKALLMVDLDGTEESTLTELEAVRQVCASGGAFETVTAGNDAEQARLWNTRKAVSPALFKVAPIKFNEDVCVPRTQVTALLRVAAGLQTGHTVRVACFGHIGDGNIHVNFMFHESQRAEAESMVEQLLREVVKLGGTLSGEHGIGSAKARFLGLEVPPREMQLMKDLKRLLDPRGILNPGKIFPE